MRGSPPLQGAGEGAAPPRLRHLRDGVRREARGLRERILRRVAARLRTEHEALAQGVRPEAVRAVDRDARGLARRVQTRETRGPRDVRVDPAHDVVQARADGDRLPGPGGPPPPPPPPPRPPGGPGAA